MEREPSAAPYIIRKLDLARRLGVSKIWLEREVRAGRFPKPIQISVRSVGWLADDVERWLAAKAAARDAA